MFLQDTVPERVHMCKAMIKKELINTTSKTLGSVTLSGKAPAASILMPGNEAGVVLIPTPSSIPRPFIFNSLSKTDFIFAQW